MVNLKKIGKIQFYFGIILLISVIVGSIFIVKEIYIGTLMTSIESATSVWSQFAQETNSSSTEITSHLIPFLMSQASIFRMTLCLYGLGALILIVLSIMLILQGLANQSRK